MDKDLGLALSLPVIWLAWLLFNVLYTLVSPVLFFLAWACESNLAELIARWIQHILEGLLN